MSLPFEGGGSPNAEPLTLREILFRPLPHQGAGDRWLIRSCALLGRSQVRIVCGFEHIDPANDPFILALNHCTRREALLVPAVMMLRRGGKLIHFMADWNFRLIPGIGLMYRRAETITVTRKSARPRCLNVLKPLYLDPLPVIERARARLSSGLSVGIFPEGRVNRDPDILLKGRTGAAWLSLETGLPIIPGGIRLSRAQTGNDPGGTALELRIGAPLHPPRRTRSGVPTAELRVWHATIMAEIARLSGKAWIYAGGRQRCATQASPHAA